MYRCLSLGKTTTRRKANKLVRYSFPEKIYLRFLLWIFRGKVDKFLWESRKGKGMDRIIRIKRCYDCPSLDIKQYTHKEGAEREFFCDKQDGKLIAADGHSTYKGAEYSTRWKGEIPDTCPLEKIPEQKIPKKQPEYKECKKCGWDGGFLGVVKGGDLDGLCPTCCQEVLGEPLLDFRSDLKRYLDSQV